VTGMLISGEVQWTSTCYVQYITPVSCWCC